MRAGLSAAMIAMVVMAMVWAAGQQTRAAPAVQGCPSCHGAAGREPPLDAVVKKVANHPTVAAKTVAQCGICHAKGPMPKPLNVIAHKIHLPSKKFAGYKGTCTSCHSVDLATGVIRVYGLERE